MTFFMFGCFFRAICIFLSVSPGPGVAGNGFSAKNDSQFRGRHSNPCPGNPLRGHFSFLKMTPEKMAKVYVYVVCFSPKMGGGQGGCLCSKRAFPKNEKWPRHGFPGHGFGSRPRNWLSFFAENPFPATLGPGEAQKVTKVTPTNFE